MVKSASSGCKHFFFRLSLGLDFAHHRLKRLHGQQRRHSVCLAHLSTTERSAVKSASPRSFRSPCTNSSTWRVPLPSASMTSNLGAAKKKTGPLYSPTVWYGSRPHGELFCPTPRSGLGRKEGSPHAGHCCTLVDLAVMSAERRRQRPVACFAGQELRGFAGSSKSYGPAANGRKALPRNLSKQVKRCWRTPAQREEQARKLDTLRRLADLFA